MFFLPLVIFACLGISDVLCITIHCGILKPFQVFFKEVVFKYYVQYILACSDKEHKKFMES